MDPRSDPLPLPPVPAADEKPHVYVINSDPAFLEMIADLLADVRVHVTLEQLRPNVAVTVANLRSARPDLLILDVVPFREDADLLLSQLEAEDDLMGLPVLLASTTPGFAEQVAQTHADFVRDILVKPFDLDSFYALLRRLLQAPL